MITIFLIYFILLIITYHSIFNVWYFNLKKGIFSELFWTFVLAAALTGFTLKFWLISMIITILIGLIVGGTCKKKALKIPIIIIFCILAVYVAVCGKNYNKANAEKKPFIENTKGCEVEPGKTYVLRSDKEIRYLNFEGCDGKSVNVTIGVCNEEYDERINLTFFVDSDDKMMYRYSESDSKSAVKKIDNQTVAMKGNILLKGDCNGVYTLATDDDHDLYLKYYKIISDKEYSYLYSNTSSNNENYQNNEEESADKELNTDDYYDDSSYEESNSLEQPIKSTSEYDNPMCFINWDDYHETILELYVDDDGQGGTFEYSYKEFDDYGDITFKEQYSGIMKADQYTDNKGILYLEDGKEIPFSLYDAGQYIYIEYTMDGTTYTLIDAEWAYSNVG